MELRENDFLSLASLNLSKGVYGGRGYELDNISDAPDLMRALYLLKQQRPALSMLEIGMESCGKVLQIGMTLETIILHRHSILKLF